MCETPPSECHLAFLAILAEEEWSRGADQPDDNDLSALVSAEQGRSSLGSAAPSPAAKA